MIILDTNVLSELMRQKRDENVTTWVGQNPLPSLYITSITQAEILYGIELLPRGRKRTNFEREAQAMFKEDFANRILTFDSAAAEEYAVIRVKRRRTGLAQSQADIQIAAIASVYGATVATRNIRDFEGCGIKLIDPWQTKIK
jgi:predicted nucleic acid-binding protein